MWVAWQDQLLSQWDYKIEIQPEVRLCLPDAGIFTSNFKLRSEYFFEKNQSLIICFAFRCSLLYIDFEGRSDGESIKRILSLVNPRNLVSSFFFLIHIGIAVDIEAIELRTGQCICLFVRFWCTAWKKPRIILLNTADRTLVYRWIRCLHRAPAKQ